MMKGFGVVTYQQEIQRFIAARGELLDRYV
jgi:hypothetical protein